jgi:alpha-D-xyloside xylohydrolase
MFGPSLLVAPVFDDANGVRYYLPPGEWTDYFTSERVSGERFRTEKNVSFFRIPLFVRENTLLAVGARDDRPDYDFLDGLGLELFALADGAEASAVVHGPTGVERARFTATRKGSQIELRGSVGKEVRALFRQAKALKTVEGGSAAEASPLGAVALWPDPSKPLRVVL